jgi:two-component system cell cycle response regulator
MPPYFMNKDELLAAVLASDKLPTLPPVASRLVALTAKDDTSFTDIANLVSQDIALSAKILKVANSAFYGLPQQISSVHQAASILGTNALGSLVLSFSFLSMGTKGCKNQFDLEDFWQRSITGAVASKLILEQVQGADTEQIFVAGMLQNMGALILCSAFPEEYDTMIAQLDQGEQCTLSLESSAFGADHTYIGYEVAKSWGFPSALVMPILYHHAPEEYRGQDKQIQASIKAVHLSDYVVNILHSDTPEVFEKQLRSKAKTLMGLTSKNIEEVLSAVHLEVAEVGQSFGIKLGELKPVYEILQAANIRLTHLNLDYEQMNKELVKAKMALEGLTKQLQEKNKVLDNLAHVDGLTEVFNNRYFQDSLDKEINRSSRKRLHFSLILIDIDHFKKFNDTHGHLVGDFVLVEFVKVLAGNLREYDILARYGGEEFVVILPESDEDAALVVAEKLRAAVDVAILKDHKSRYKVTASFGVSCYDGGAEEIPDKKELIKRADIALYEAKGQGRNKVAPYRPKKKWFKGK